MIFIVSKISAPQARKFDFSQKNRASGRDIFKTMKSRARSCPHRPLCGASGGIRHRRNRHMHPFRDGRIVDLSDNRLVPAGISCHLDRPLDRPMGAPCLQPFGIAQRSVEIAAELILCPRVGGASALSIRQAAPAACRSARDQGCFPATGSGLRSAIRCWETGSRRRRTPLPRLPRSDRGPAMRRTARSDWRQSAAVRAVRQKVSP